MTDGERSRIIALQYKGYGYKRIATETGLALNTVKSFCARHNNLVERMALAERDIEVIQEEIHHDHH